MSSSQQPASVPAPSAFPFCDYAAVQDYLFSLKACGLKFGIDRMRGFAEALGHPDRDVPVLHVTGTNGKGSTSAMLEAILREAGWKVGLYTSPHLVRLGERVQVNREILSEQEIIQYTNDLLPIARQVSKDHPEDHPSFFEFMTAMAFLQFKRKACDVSVVEVGLGGELDATNIVQPEVSVITSISLDHCDMLGDTHAKIASAKAGIIKAGRPLVIGRLPQEAEVVIRKRAHDLDCKVYSVCEVFGESLENYPQTNLGGEYQRWNAATATLVARILGERWGLDADTIRRGLLKVSWPGRWQHSHIGSRPLILDASHNPEGATVLESNLRALVEQTGLKPVVITGVLGAARATPLLQVIARYAKEIHLVVPNQARACTFDELQALVPADFKGGLYRDSVERLFPFPDCCTAGSAGDLLLVTGSIYLLGEILARIEPGRGRGEGRLQDF